MNDRVTGGLRVECARPSDPGGVWVYRVAEHPDGHLFWWLWSIFPSPYPGKAEILLPRCGDMGGTPVTAREAEVVLGWPESGYDRPENPAFDALRELVHAAGNS